MPDSQVLGEGHVSLEGLKEITNRKKATAPPLTFVDEALAPHGTMSFTVSWRSDAEMAKEAAKAGKGKEKERRASKASRARPEVAHMDDMSLDA